MENKEIIEGNIIIATFDGWYQDRSINRHSDINWLHKDKSTKLVDDILLPSSSSSFDYHSSFDSIIPVVEKIKSLEFHNGNSGLLPLRIIMGFDGLGNYCHIESYGIGIGFIPQFHINNQESTLIAVWKAVIEFIKWYEELKAKQEYFVMNSVS